MSVAIWNRFFKAVLLGRRPNYLIAFVNGRCNMKCSFCCDAAMSIRKDPELSPEQWGRAVSGADSLIHATITGGEPFLRKDLPDVIDQMQRNSGLRRVSVNTNGFYSDRILSVMTRVLEESEFEEVCLQISLDGDEQTHDAVRNLPGAFAAARKSIDMAADLRNSHPNFTLRTQSVILPENAEKLESFLDETASWPIDFHEVIMVRDVPKEVQVSLAEAYERLTDKQLQRASKRFARKLDWRIERALRNDVLDYVLDRRRPEACLAGGRLVQVLTDGTVRGCEITKMWDTSVIGTVAEGMRLVDIVETREAEAFRAKARICSCSFECAKMCNTVFTPSRWGRLF